MDENTKHDCTHYWLSKISRLNKILKSNRKQLDYANFGKSQNMKKK
ncbi:MAG: hypothetical protein BAJATHORv1_50143 [Candidatus Thorarchaeota archaeon]|nr:MAG: hypothetical protein BAJATHORv1_50143 [Candidatus Thorarchaeota archaeon]